MKLTFEKQKVENTSQSALTPEQSKNLSNATDNIIRAYNLGKDLKIKSSEDISENDTIIRDGADGITIEHIPPTDKALTPEQEQDEIKTQIKDIAPEPAKNAIDPVLSKRLSDATDSIIRANELRERIKQGKI